MVVVALTIPCLLPPLSSLDSLRHKQPEEGPESCILVPSLTYSGLRTMRQPPLKGLIPTYLSNNRFPHSQGPF